MVADADGSSVEDLDTALRLYRRLLLRIVLILLGGVALAVMLSGLGALLAPPYGVRLLGQGLETWGLFATLALLLAEVWVDGRAMGRALRDPMLQWLPVVGVLSGMTIIAQRAHALGMEWGGFLGPLRPVRRK